MAVPPATYSVALGNSLSLTCVARGQPLPTISWLRDGTPIVSGMDFNITVSQLNSITTLSILELCDVQLVHSGEYVCTAENYLTVGSQTTLSNVVTHEFNISLLRE